MVDGRSDSGGAAKTPLSGFPIEAQREPICRLPPRDEALIEERDYMNLSLSNPGEQGFHQCASSPLERAKVCQGVVLSLGLGLPDGEGSHEAGAKEQPLKVDDQHLKAQDALCGPKPQNFWHENFRASLTNDHHQAIETRHADAAINFEILRSCSSSAVEPWSSMQGRIAVPMQKASTLPAKRPYHDDGGSMRSTAHANSSTGVAWQPTHMGYQQVLPNQLHGSTVGSSANGQGLKLTVPLSTPMFKGQQASCTSMPPPNSNCAIVNGSASLQVTEGSEQEPGHGSIKNKAPVVGWPPVRSFRRNTLQAAHRDDRMVSVDPRAKGTGLSSLNGGSDVSNPLQGRNAKTSFFVKAKLDGVRICRKVDLSAYSSYDELKVALEDLFQVFVSDNTKLDLVNGSSYVLTHEDKDGDCLLVGDVPWHMFLESAVKSLRIMRSMDSTGENGFAKMKVPASGNQL